MAREKNLFDGVDDTDLNEILQFGQKMYIQPRNQDTQSDIEKLKGAYRRFMPEIYGRNVRDLEGVPVSGVDARKPEESLNQAEWQNIGNLNSKIALEIRNRGIRSAIQERLAQEGLPPVDENALEREGRAVPPENGQAPGETAKNASRGIAASQPETSALPEQSAFELQPLPDSTRPIPVSDRELAAQTQTGVDPKADTGPQLFSIEERHLPSIEHTTSKTSGLSGRAAVAPTPSIPLGPPGVYNDDLKMVQAYLTSMGHKETVGEINGLPGEGTARAVDAYTRANGLGKMSMAELASHMKAQMRSGTVNPGTIGEKLAVSPATQTMTTDGDIVDGQGRSPGSNFSNAATNCPPEDPGTPAPVTAPHQNPAP